MMANWDVLNKKFDDALSSMNEELWSNWMADKEKKREIRKSLLKLQAKLQEEKIKMSQFEAKSILNFNGDSSDVIVIELTCNNKNSGIATNIYAFAA